MKKSNNSHKTQQYAQKHSPGSTDIDPHDLDRIAYKSDEPIRAWESIFQINCDMRKRYAELMSGLIENLSPVIMANSEVEGGESTLIYDAIQEIEESDLSNIEKRLQVY